LFFIGFIMCTRLTDIRLIIFAVLLGTFFCGIAFATEGAKPAALLWNNKDVPPLCLDRMLMGETQLKNVDVATCNEDPEKDIMRTYREDGWVKTDYRYKADGDDYPALTSMYRVIGRVKDGYALEISSLTGGSGRFTSVAVVRLDGPLLHLAHSYGGGDRCNRGVADAAVKNGILSYGLYMTPGDFPSLAYGDDQGLVAYEDLESSALSCFAVARYTDDRLDEIELLPKAFQQDQEDWTSNYTSQPCMNNYLRKAIKTGKIRYSLEEFKALMNGFMQTCKKP
jgi:hypothetical protein